MSCKYENCSGLTSVTIPGSVTSIGYRAFAFCSSLKDMFCYAENVPMTDTSAFNRSSRSRATLHVPAGSVEVYKAASNWNKFMEIVAIKGTSIDGDLNGDNVVDANDVVALVNMIAVGDASAAADLNGDGKVDIADLIKLVNIITGQ